MALWQLAVTVLTGFFLAHTILAYRGDRSHWRLLAYGLAGALCYSGSRLALMIAPLKTIPLLIGMTAALGGLFLYCRFRRRHSARLVRRTARLWGKLGPRWAGQTAKSSIHPMKGGVS